MPYPSSSLRLDYFSTLARVIGSESEHQISFHLVFCSFISTSLPKANVRPRQASDQPMEQQAPDVELEAEHQEQSQPPVIVSLDIFQSVRQAQAQHGLRHSDYKRYR